MNVNIKPLGNVQVAAPCSIIDLILQVKPEELNNFCAAKIDGNVVDLRDIIEKDCDIELLDKEAPESLAILRHTTAHIMAEAVKHLYPEAKLTIGPSTDKGFFYDFDFRPFNREDLDAIEKEMKSIIKKATRLEATKPALSSRRRTSPINLNSLMPSLPTPASPSTARTTSSTSARVPIC